MPKHPPVKDGERVHPLMDKYKMSCCDCGLVHLMNFRALRVTKKMKKGWFEYEELDPKKYRIVLWASRDNRATGQIRRWRKKK